MDDHLQEPFNRGEYEQQTRFALGLRKVEHHTRPSRTSRIRMTPPHSSDVAARSLHFARWLSIAGLAALALAASAGSAPRKWYWSEAKAEAIVVAKARIPDCAVSPSDKCANGMYLPNGRPVGGSFSLGDATCTGKDELRETFTYSRFTCTVVPMYGHYFSARIAVYPSGPKTLRWKLLSIRVPG